MGSERKRRQQQVLATELWMRLEGLELEGQKEVKICRQHTCSPDRSGPWISRGCMLVLGLGLSKVWIREVRKGRTLASTRAWDKETGKAAAGVLFQSWE